MLFQKPNKVRDGGFSGVRIFLYSVFFLCISLFVVDVEVAFGQTRTVTMTAVNGEGDEINLPFVVFEHTQGVGNTNAVTPAIVNMSHGHVTINYSNWHNYAWKLKYIDSTPSNIDCTTAYCTVRSGSDNVVIELEYAPLYLGFSVDAFINENNVHVPTIVNIESSPQGYGGSTPYEVSVSLPLSIRLTAPNTITSSEGAEYLLHRWYGCDRVENQECVFLTREYEPSGEPTHRVEYTRVGGDPVPPGSRSILFTAESADGTRITGVPFEVNEEIDAPRQFITPSRVGVTEDLVRINYSNPYNGLPFQDATNCTPPILTYLNVCEVIFNDGSNQKDVMFSYGPSSGGGGGGGGGGTNHTLRIQSNQLGAFMTVTNGTNCIINTTGGCGDQTIPAGTTVTITAALNATGDTFSAWTGDCDSVVDRTCSIVMSGDKTVSATYDTPVQPPTACLAAGDLCVRSTDCKQIASGANGTAPDFGGCALGQVCCAETFAGDSCEVGERTGTCTEASACGTNTPGVGQGICNNGDGMNSGFVCCFPVAEVGGPPLTDNPRDFENPTINIVPCGLKTYVNYLGSGPDGGVQYFDECTICHLQVLAMKLLHVLLTIGLVFAALLFANAGILYATASASASNIAKAHKLFLGTLIGLVLVLVAYALIDVMMKMLLPGDDGNVNGFGPWNTILCPAAGPTTQYTVPGISPVVTTVTGGGGSERPPVTLPETCQGFGGRCSPDLVTGGDSCGSGETNRGTFPDCSSGNSCCVPATSGVPCSAGGSNGVCLAESGCSAVNSGQGDCGAGFVCCTPQLGGAPGSGSCAESYLQPYFGAHTANISRVCQIESRGDPIAPSGSDKCLDGKAFSWGLFQINLTVHKIGGLDCPSAFSGKNYTCRVTNQNLYDQCVAKAIDPAVNAQYAVGLMNGRRERCKYDDWRCSAIKAGLCNYVCGKCCWGPPSNRRCLQGC